MLMLPIIFIITIPVMTHTVKIDNPLPMVDPPPSADAITLRIDFEGTLLWSTTAADRATMQGYISLEAQKLLQPEVHVAVHKFAKYEIVAQTLADLRFRGLKTIGFVNNDFL